MSHEELKCSRCPVSGFVGGPSEQKRVKFLEKSGWRRVGGAWVCNFCTGIGITGEPYEGPDQFGEGEDLKPFGGEQ